MTEHDFSNTSRRLGAAAMDILSDHAELLALELQEQKRNSSQQLIWLGLTAACFFMLFLTLNGLIVVLFWQPYKHLLLLAMLLFYAVLGALCFWRVKSNQRNSQAPFSATLQELKKTKEQLLP